VTGSLAEGLTSPNKTSAIALPVSYPGIKAQRMAFTSSTHGIKAAPGECKTTMVFWLAAAAVLIRLFWSVPKERVFLSSPSVEY